MIKKYTVKTEGSIYELDLSVNEAIQMGWEPIGGVSVINLGMRITYAQALVLRAGEAK
jgi:hypothetical protein